MTSKRRIGAEASETRARIIEAAEQVIRDKGYAATSSRRVATWAGLKPSLVHYYFPTTDDLFLAVFKRGAEQSDAMIERALSSDDPVRALWRFFSDTSRTSLSLEFMAFALHRETIRQQIALHIDAMRNRQALVIEQALGSRLAEVGAPSGLSVILAGIGRAMVMEGALGIQTGHAEARATIGAWLDRLLGPPVTEVDPEPQRCWTLVQSAADPEQQGRIARSHEWSVGDLLIWDNTGTMHRAEPYDKDCGRLMHRTKLQGEEPFE
ncbi:MAG: TetR family transcriptional regulator [Sphingomicrobium sp.]